MILSPSKNQNAFTFIELLITVSVMIISLSIAVVNYLRFFDKQKLYQSGSSIEAILKDARSKAQNGFLGNEEIGFCAKLAAVEVFSGLTTNDKVSVTMQLHCANEDLLIYETYIIEEKQTSFDQNFKISFLPIHGATVSLAGSSVASGSAVLSRSESEVLFNLDQGGTVDVKYE